MRLGLGVAWTAVIVAEIVAVKSGLGYVLWDAYHTSAAGTWCWPTWSESA